MHTRRGFAEATGLAIAVIAAGVTYAILAVHPWAHTPLNQFLATFGRANAAVWPMQIIWYLAAVAMVGLAFQRAGRSSQLICALAAAYSAWVAIAYFAWQMPGMNLSWLWAAVFTLQAVLLLMAGTVRSDLVIRPRKDVTSALGAVFIGYALIGYPVLGLLGGHPLHNLPVLGLSPCATVVFFSGLLLWARPPVPKYLLPLPLAWALVAAPPDSGHGRDGRLRHAHRRSAHSGTDHLARPHHDTGLADRDRRAATRPDDRLVRPRRRDDWHGAHPGGPHARTSHPQPPTAAWHGPGHPRLEGESERRLDSVRHTCTARTIAPKQASGT